MAEPILETGVTEKVYLAGVNIATGPAKFGFTAMRAETSDLLQDGTRTVDRALWWDGCQAVPRKMGFELGWDTIQPSDALLFQRLIGSPDAFDLCLWKYVTEWFAHDGTRTAFRLSADSALQRIDSGLLPTNASTRFPVYYEKGTGITDLVVYPSSPPSPDEFPDSEGRLGFTAAALTTGQYTVVSYVPLWRVRVVDAQERIDSRTQGLTLKLEQV